MEIYLRPTFYINFDHPRVKEFAESRCNASLSKREKAVQLYYAVRDEIRYDPYDFKLDRHNFTADSVLKKKSGYCVVKAVLLAGAARYHSIPARLGFADVRNHLSTPRLRELMETDIFMYHGYTELHLEGRWVKATPAFNLSLCNHFNVKPLEFDGVNNSLFHEFDTLGNQHMEYVKERGHFDDLPFEQILEDCRIVYPRFFEKKNNPGKDFV
ncbi:MAG: transglutaminase family protein [Desulfamplus sp.]|nr:transglutaminase family protein [Desulfamplus sp.]